MSNRVIITCPHFSEGAGGVATFYKVYAEKQTQNARLFYIGRDKPCGMIKSLLQLIVQFVHLLFIIHSYDLLVVNPSLAPNAIKRDTLSVKIARLFGKKTCVFWRGFNEGYFQNVVRHQYKDKLKRGLFNVNYTIVLGENIYKKYHSIGLNTPYSMGSTMLDGGLLRNTPKEFSSQRFSILFLARIIKAKGIYEALNAFEKFNLVHPESDFVIAGSGDELEPVKSLVKSRRLEAISFLGDVRGERKRACYETADVYLFPSYTEGMPNSVLEAMGMGLPVVTSSVGAVPDFFEDGKMGVLMQGHSEEEILNALETLYAQRNSLSDISDYNRKYAAQHFVDEVVIANMEKLFAQI